MKFHQSPLGFTFIFLFLTVSGLFSGLPEASALDLQALLEEVKKAETPQTQIGIHVLSLTDSQELMAYKHDVPFNPASNMKVITAAASLAELGVDYTFKTLYTTDQPPTDGRLINLYVTGKGDPSLSEERLWRVAKNVAQRGIREIQGDIVIDQGFFLTSGFDGDFKDMEDAYGAPSAPFSLNYNTFSIVVQPTQPEKPALVTIDPPCDYFTLDGTVNTGKGQAFTVSRRYADGHEVISLKGSVNGTDPHLVYRTISQPSFYAGAALKKYLADNGIIVRGRVREGSAQGSHLLTVDVSPPLAVIIRDLNKYSNNFIAEMLLKNLGALKKGIPGTTEKGALVLQEYLNGLNLSPSDYRLVNGSGLSRDNRIAPRVLTRVLQAAHRDEAYRAEFMASLAIAGIDGTVRRRLRSDPLKGKMRVKTGTLDNVSSLSGYLPTKSGQMISFAMIANGPQAWKLHALQEKITLQLAEY